MAYDLTAIPGLVRASLEANQDRFDTLQKLYTQRSAYRTQNYLPVVIWAGYGRAGKDTAAQICAKHFGLAYSGSLSRIALPFIAYSLGLPEKEAWQQRHANREFWFHWLNEFRRVDPTLLVKLSLGVADVVAGIRSGEELAAVRRAGMADLVVWVDRSHTPVDPTVTYSPKDCHVVLGNEASLADFEDTVVGFLSGYFPQLFSLV